MMQSPYEIIDERFRWLINPTARIEKLYDGCRWAEGPAYFAAGKYLLWSDIPNSRMLRYDENDGHVSVFRVPSHHSNGNAVDLTGRLISCEHHTRRVTRTNYDGSITILATHHEGKRLNSPNDVVVKSDGSIWFTDPTYGIDSDYEGGRAESEIGASHVYRIDPLSGEVTRVADDFVKPNGLAFSPDETKLYISDTGRTHGDHHPAHIRVFDVSSESRLRDGRVFAECTSGIFDGFRIDERGRIWSSAQDGVHCIETDGTLIGKIRVPETVANVCFGGLHRNRLYICGTTSLYSVYLFDNGTRTI
ncbi:SMP-30/gluconolactonase/LRE family protein [Brytella acorum]|uniref:SMP-30/gluconolactonase/LRE family protein n=1 Tax=Brytella acorum TaxID=2959299 RepID=A0AA35UVQ4_9PROT|nr:SMP-30/gluconolactonase/LRE family protein [Brytella acorum]MDF3625494.1 SMP-30/gluconolactonase/LRE family protein [Brytella acorum]CAI9120347.1 SMP-30/gluconolactonase/LRE family protein [Brytella acorum]